MLYILYSIHMLPYCSLSLTDTSSNQTLAGALAEAIKSHGMHKSPLLHVTTCVHAGLFMKSLFFFTVHWYMGVHTRTCIHEHIGIYWRYLTVVHLKKFNLGFSRSSFVILVNLFHPGTCLFVYSLFKSLFQIHLFSWNISIPQYM